MCGIVGLIRTNNSGLNVDFAKFFKTLLILDQFRGAQSTGLFAVPETNIKGGLVIAKRAMNPLDFLDLNSISSVVDNLKDYQYIIGHNRYATKGNIVNQNAHPFYNDNIVLVHNGTVHSFGDYKKEVDKFIVDSAAITYLFSKYNPIDVLKEITGSYALVWYDYKEDVLNLIRNDDRPLELFETSFGYALASEGWMIDAASAYSNYKILERKHIKPYVLHSIYADVVPGKGNKNYLEYVVKETDYTAELKKETTNYTYNYKGPYSDYYKEKVIIPGVAIGDTIEFEIDAFDSYKNAANKTNYGSLYGFSKYPSGGIFGVISSSCTKEFFDYAESKKETSLLTGCVTYVCERSAHNNAKIKRTYATVTDLKLILKKEEKTALTIVPTMGVSKSDEVSSKSNRYGCGLEKGGNLIMDWEGWYKRASIGCCNCQTNLSPTIYNQNADIVTTGNAVADDNYNLWCEDCWLTERMDMRN